MRFHDTLYVGRKVGDTAGMKILNGREFVKEI
jgi:hypothetical protein